MNAQIIMTTYSRTARKMIVVHPEDEFDTDDLLPMFWSDSGEKYVTVPGYTAAAVYEEWIAE
jgi:hypothetical protein